MYGKSLRIGLVSGSGALTGCFMSLQLSGYAGVGGGSFWFWLFGFLGMFAGGIFAYIAYDFRGFCRGAGGAWRLVMRTDFQLKSRSKYFVKTWIDVNIIEIFAGFWLLLFFCLFGFVVARQTPMVLFFGENPEPRLIKVSVSVLLCLSQFFPMILGVCSFMENTKYSLGVFIAFFNPLTALFFRMPRSVIKAGRYTVPRLPGVICVFWRFLKTLIFFVHSDEKLICLVAATFGAGFGHFIAGNALVGFALGFLVGIAEIVSKRILGIAR